MATISDHMSWGTLALELRRARGQASRMKRTIVLAALLVAARAHAETDPAIAKLEKSLPPGGTGRATATELVIRHDRPCYVTEPPATTSMGGGPVVTLELRYHL